MTDGWMDDENIGFRLEITVFIFDNKLIDKNDFTTEMVGN